MERYKQKINLFIGIFYLAYQNREVSLEIMNSGWHMIEQPFLGGFVILFIIPILIGIVIYDFCIMGKEWHNVLMFTLNYGVCILSGLYFQLMDII